MWGIAILALSGSLGCDRIKKMKEQSGSGEGSSSEGVAAAEKKPLSISWADRTGTLSGGSETIEVLGTKTDYSITLKGFKKGSKYTVGEKTGAVDSDIYDMVTINVRDKLGPLELEKLREVDLGLEISLELADGRSGKSKLPAVYFDYGIREVLQGTENGAVMFGPESADEQPENCLVWATTSEIERYGNCTTVQGIDFVAVDHELPDEKGRRVCTGYTNKDKKPVPDLTVIFKDTEVTIFERRTGKIVEKKSFPSDKDCPMFATTSSNDNHTKDAYRDTKAIQSWLRTKPKR